METMRRSAFVLVWLMLCSLALGAAWTTRRLTNGPGNSHYPSIVASDSAVYAVWSYDMSGNHEVYFGKSITGGSTWQIAQKLTDNKGESHNPVIAVNGSNVFVAWQDDTPGNNEIYFKKSTDGGATWQHAKRLTNNTGDSCNPAIAVSGTTLFVVWDNDTPRNNNIYFRKSVDDGATWQTAERLTDNTGDSSSPALAVSGANVNVVWSNTTWGNGEVCFRKSTDSGATWQTVQRITNNAGNSKHLTIAIDGPIVYLSWTDYTPGNGEIYFGKSSDGGATWQTAKRLTSNSGESFNSRIAISGASVYLVWQDPTPGNYEIYFRKSADGGSTWQAAQRLTKTAGFSGDPEIAVNSSSVFVVWSDSLPARNSDIYLKYSHLH